jgi:hypothetical protein
MVKYVDFGHGPWKNTLMLDDGTPHDWIWYGALRKRPDLLPAVPLEIRWYLTRMGILDSSGVNQLRPLIAHWFSY